MISQSTTRSNYYYYYYYKTRILRTELNYYYFYYFYYYYYYNTLYAPLFSLRPAYASPFSFSLNFITRRTLDKE